MKYLIPGIVALGGATILATILMAGCSSHSTPGLSSQQQQDGDTANAIIARTNGDWSTLSQADKDTLTKTIGGGSESMAEQVYEIGSRKPGGAEPPKAGQNPLATHPLPTQALPSQPPASQPLANQP